MQYRSVKKGIFQARPNRFIAHVEVDGGLEVVHVKNTGRCGELLIPGVEVWCTYHDDPKRKTQWSLITVRKGDTLFNIDSQVPNRLAGEWMQQGGLGVTVEQQKAEGTDLQFYNNFDTLMGNMLLDYVEDAENEQS